MVVAPKTCERCHRATPVLAYVKLTMVGDKNTPAKSTHAWTCRGCAKGKR